MVTDLEVGAPTREIVRSPLRDRSAPVQELADKAFGSRIAIVPPWWAFQPVARHDGYRTVLPSSGLRFSAGNGFGV